MGSKTDNPSENILHQRKLVYENAVFEIFLYDIKTEAGRTVQDYLIVAPKNKDGNLITGIAVLPVADGKVGMIKIYRPAIQGYSWEIPRGFVDKDEDSTSSARRELEEETGLQCQVQDLIPLGFVTPDAGILAARVELFAAMYCAKVRIFRVNEIGHREFCFFEPPQVETMIESSAIQDPCTIITINNT